MLVTEIESRDEIGVDSYQLERLGLIRIDPNLARWLALSREHRLLPCSYRTCATRTARTASTLQIDARD